MRNFRVKTSLAAALALVFLTVQPCFAGFPSADEFNAGLRRGINFGNALDAPKEGEWGVVLQTEYFKLIKTAGFSHVRLPVRWSSHAGSAAPYTIEPAFLARVDWAVKEARANGLKVVLDMHHYEEFETNPNEHSERFFALWEQIAEHFSSSKSDLAFEIYNEPSKNIDADKWNDLFARALKLVRAKNPKRIVVVGPCHWNSIDQLSTLKLPDDGQLIVTVHYYEPFHFTHQGAEWIGKESKDWLGTRWTDSPGEVAAIKASFDKTQLWAVQNKRPIYLGEFGAYSKADIDSRVRWTTAVRDQAISHGFSMAYWEFCSGFGAYDTERKGWRIPLLKALVY